MRTNAILMNGIKAVMGWDIGDGDSVAFVKFIVGGDNVSKPLYLHKSRDQQVEKSAVAQNSSGMITIGADAAKQKEFAINFKRAPGNWNQKDVMGLTYRQHMSDYIRGVSEVILQNSANRSILKNIITQGGNGEMHWKKDEVLLVVGCPSSVIWKGEKARKQYEGLISEATGISNVIVTEESRAAVFSLFEIDNIRKKINLQNGVLVLDFGSSTADATYILPGKKIINISWELGAAWVENAMLEYVLQSNKAKKELANQAKLYDKERVLAARNDCSHAVFQLGQDKEDYFDGKLGEDAIPETVRIPVIDEDGDRLFEDDGDFVELEIKYSVTDAMMQYALDEYKFDARKNGDVVNHGTWKENCRQFLNDVKQTLEREKLPVQTVVVTGGGSQMPFTVELSSEAFPGKVVPSSTPSHSVVKGLTTIAYNEVKAPGVHKKAMDDIKSDAAKNVDAMIESIAANLADKAYDAAVSAVNGLTVWSDNDTLIQKIVSNFDFSDTNVGEITRAIKNAIDNSLNKNIGTQISDSTKNWIDQDNTVIVQCINKAAQQLYADRAVQDMVRISQADIKVITNSISLPNVSMPDVAKDVNFIGKIVGYILSAVLFVVLAVLAAILPVIGPVFVGVTGMLGSTILIDKMKEWENCPVSGGAVRKAVRKMREDKSEKMKEIKESLNKSLREAFTKPDIYGEDFEKHYMVLMETAEIAFNRILLKAEDDR